MQGSDAEGRQHIDEAAQRLRTGTRFTGDQ